MVRDRQHGPVIELNRISAARARQQQQQQDQSQKTAPAAQKPPPPHTNQDEQQQQDTPPAPTAAAGAAAATVPKKVVTVFEQMVSKSHQLGPEALLLPHRAWKVKFVGECSVLVWLFFVCCERPLHFTQEVEGMGLG